MAQDEHANQLDTNNIYITGFEFHITHTELSINYIQ